MVAYRSIDRSIDRSIGRSIACAVALSGPGERWIPYRQRRRAINALLDLVFRDPAELMLYAGLVDTLGAAPCGGLLPE